MPKAASGRTYNFLSLLDTGLNLWDMPRRLIIIELFNLMLAQYRYVLFRRQFALAKALACNALRHVASALRLALQVEHVTCADFAGQPFGPGGLSACAALFRDKNASQYRRYGCQSTRTVQRMQNRDACDGLGWLWVRFGVEMF